MKVCLELHRPLTQLGLPPETVAALEPLLAARAPQAVLDKRISSIGTIQLHRYPDETPDARRFLFDGLNTFLGERVGASGYFIVCAHPGIGKTAFIANLVARRQCIHHFNSQPEGITSVDRFIGNVAAQLVLRFRLDQKSFPDTAFQDGVFLKNLLEQAAREATDTDPLLIAIDAIDEADPGESVANPLFLPIDPPPNVFFVLTTRPESRQLQATHMKTVIITGTETENLDDVKAFLYHYHSKSSSNIDRELFVRELTDKSEGNFMYLRYVLPELTETTEIESLPQGLLGYYQNHWEKIRGREPDTFENLYRPVISVLAAAETPLTVPDIATLHGLDQQHVHDALRLWSPFIIRDTETGLVRLYHKSFADFLHHEIGLAHTYQKMLDQFDSLFGD